MCEISINKVGGNGPQLESITVIGNVQGCDPRLEGEPALIVQITCPTGTVAFFGPDLPFQGIVIDPSSVFIGSNGDFFATFNSLGDCRCGGQMLVTAECATEEDCRAELLVESLRCIECPEETDFGDNFDATAPPQPECVDAEATAEVTLRKFFTNNTPNDLLFEIEPGHPDAIIVSGGSQTIKKSFDGQVSAVVQYPSGSSPQPYVTVKLAVTGELLGCPPWPIALGQIPDCCPDVRITNVEPDGCQVVVNVEPDNLPRGCKYRWNFDAKIVEDDECFGTWMDGSFSQQVHPYDKNGEYKICAAVQCGSCTSEPAFTTVNITECKGEDSKQCSRLRWAATLAAAFAILAGLLAQCVPPKVAVALYIAAAALAVTAVVTGLLYRFREKCKSKPCRIWALTTARTLLIAGFAAIALSGCCMEMIGAGLPLIGGGMALLAYWRDKCGTWCDLLEEFAGAGGLAATAVAIAALIPQLSGCIDWTATGIVGVIHTINGAYIANDCELPLVGD